MQEPLSNENLLLVGSIAKVLHGNGQQTDETIRTTDRVARHLGYATALVPGWGEMLFRSVSVAGRQGSDVIDVIPNSVAINRVSAAGAVAENVIAGRLTVSQAQREIRSAAVAPPLPDAVFALACAIGATALSVTFGVAHIEHDTAANGRESDDRDGRRQNQQLGRQRPPSHPDHWLPKIHKAKLLLRRIARQSLPSA